MLNKSTLVTTVFSLTLSLVACEDDETAKPDGGQAATDGGSGDSPAPSDDSGAAVDAPRDTASATDGGMTPADVARDGGGITGDAGVGDGLSSAKLDPPASGKGIQIVMKSTLAPGIETERCMFYRVPPEGLNVVDQEVKYTAGSHHAVLWTTSYADIPTKDNFGRTVDTSGVFECKEGTFGIWNATGIAMLQQVADGPATVGGLPKGVAVKIPGNSLLLVNTHYLNASDKSLDTDLYVNLHTIPAADVTQEAGIMFLYDAVIRVPAKGQAQARMRCPMHRDLTILNAQSHMHARGVGFQADVVDPAAGTKTLLYRTTDWAEVSARKLDPAVTAKAGSFVDFACEYRNTEDRVVRQGFTTRDEMCVVIALYYPRHLQTEYCSATPDFSGVAFGGAWVGSGTKDGAQTAACMRQAPPRFVEQGDALWSCVVDSCPAISSQMSNAGRCLATWALGGCRAQCEPRTDVAGCKTCIQAAEPCNGALTQLEAAQCQ